MPLTLVTSLFEHWQCNQAKVDDAKVRQCKMNPWKAHEMSGESVLENPFWWLLPFRKLAKNYRCGKRDGQVCTMRWIFGRFYLRSTGLQILQVYKLCVCLNCRIHGTNFWLDIRVPTMNTAPICAVRWNVQTENSYMIWITAVFFEEAQVFKRISVLFGWQLQVKIPDCDFKFWRSVDQVPFGIWTSRLAAPSVINVKMPPPGKGAIL